MWAVALSTERSPSSVESVKDSLTILASLIVPGLGQLRLGRALDGALFLALAVWLRLVLASYGWILTTDKDALGAALWGAMAIPDPVSAPLARNDGPVGGLLEQNRKGYHGFRYLPGQDACVFKRVPFSRIF